MKMTIIKLFMIYFISLILGGCCICKYKANKSFIKSSCKFENGFMVAKIKMVDSLNFEGRPIKFEYDTVVQCSTHGDMEWADDELEAFKKNKINIQEFGFHFKSQNKIHFKKVNKFYKWWLWDPYKPSITYDTMPIQFIKGYWYHIFNLESGDGMLNYEIFLFIDEKNRVTAKEFYNSGPF